MPEPYKIVLSRVDLPLTNELQAIIDRRNYLLPIAIRTIRVAPIGRCEIVVQGGLKSLFVNGSI